MESNDSSDINKITLECFINKNCKDKYLKIMIKINMMK